MTFRLVSIVDFPASSAIDLPNKEVNFLAYMRSVLNASLLHDPANLRPREKHAPAKMLQQAWLKYLKRKKVNKGTDKYLTDDTE